MNRARRLASLLPTVGAACALLAGNQAIAEQAPEVTVATATELIEALEPGQRARRIRLRAGRYALAAPVSVPDGFELEGEGVMQVDPDGLPMGFAHGTETTLVASEGLEGDVITMGDGASLRGLRIEGPDRVAASGDASAAGNVVMIASRRPGDRLKAFLRDCEIVNYESVGFNDIGPTGRTIAIITRHRRTGSDWHQRSQVSVSIERSIVRNRSDGNSIFAINFAGGASIVLDFERNRIEGHLGVAGGAGRPDKVTGSSATLQSRGNLYVSAGESYPIGWAIIGGSAAPHEPLTEGAESNSVRVESHGDRIEGYRIGIRAMAGRLISGMPGVAEEQTRRRVAAQPAQDPYGGCRRRGPVAARRLDRGRAWCSGSRGGGASGRQRIAGRDPGLQRQRAPRKRLRRFVAARFPCCRARTAHQLRGLPG